MVESYIYEKLNGELRCKTCNHRCRIKPDEWGRCNVRKNENGVLNVYNYGMTSSIAVDPIEKKPLYNFKPGSSVLSFGTISCNFQCPFCQNFEIVNADLTFPFLRELTPQDVAQMVQSRADGIAWTYNEPAIWHEFTLDSSKLVKEKDEGYYVVYVTNGYPSTESIDQHVLDAANVDIKAFSEKFYNELCHARLDRVLESAEHMHKKGIFLETTYLIIPGENDSPEELKDFAEWVYGLDKRIPVHFSRFTPMYKMGDKPSTPLETLENAARITRDVGVEYVYLGNVRHEMENTFCPNCGHTVINRDGFSVTRIDLEGKKCPNCGYEQNIVL